MYIHQEEFNPGLLIEKRVLSYLGHVGMFIDDEYFPTIGWMTDDGDRERQEISHVFLALYEL